MLTGDAPCGYLGRGLALNATPDHSEEWAVFYLLKTQPDGARIPVAKVLRTDGVG